MSKRYVRSNGGGNNKWTASSSHHSSRGRGRGYGRGGRSFGRGGRFSNHSFVRNEAPQTTTTTANKKWVRPANIEKQEVADDNETSALKSLPEENEIRDGSKNNDISDSKAGETITPSSDVLKSEQNLERRGRNKLVMKKKTNEPDISSERKVKHISDPVPTEIIMAEETITSSSDVDKPEQSLERQGRHKLVLKKNEPDISSSIHDANVPTESRTEEQRTLDVHKPEQHLERRGRHKLVLKKDETEAIPKIPNPNQNKSTEDDIKYSWKRKSTELTASSNDEKSDTSKQDGIPNESKRAGSKKTLPVKRKHHESIHGPRRIYLSSAATEEGKATDAPDEQPQKTMTDFQYKDASARGGRGKGKAMGLVRVKPKNPSETPICPTFSRGLPCNNPKCRLRHDVSTEASRPICVFFQRNGMCSKGEDCPFKHVKISWDAEICPTFERLGYCEDEGCVLRHVASKRSKNKR